MVVSSTSESNTEQPTVDDSKRSINGSKQMQTVYQTDKELVQQTEELHDVTCQDSINWKGPTYYSELPEINIPNPWCLMTGFLWWSRPNHWLMVMMHEEPNMVKTFITSYWKH